jgi:hypothetical protein
MAGVIELSQDVPAVRGVAATRRLAFAAASSCIAVFILCAVSGSILNESNPSDDQTLIEELGLILGFGGFLLAGVLISVNRPGNAIGWLLCIGATAAGLTFVAGEYTVYAMLTSPGSLPAVKAVAWFQSWSWLPSIALVLVFLPLYFPNGKLPSRRWRPVPVIAAAAVVANTLPFMFAPELDVEVPDDTPPVSNPLAIDLGAAWDIMEAVSFFVIILTLLLAFLSLIVRFRKAEGDEKEQIKWLTYSVGILVVSAFAEPILPEIASYLFVLALISVAAAIAIAVLKYRLYDIDVLINRTLVYVPLTAIVIGLYTALVGVLKTLITEVTDEDTDAAVALTTLLVVAGLTPLKNQLQILVDRYFKEQRDPLPKARKVIAQAASVLQVLESDRFVQALLIALIADLDAAGARVELDQSDDRRSWVIGLPGEGHPITTPLQLNGRPVGTLLVWRQPGHSKDQPSLSAALTEAAQVLTKVICLAPGRGSTAAPAPAAMEAPASAAILP